jgi:hypothetical protein
MDWIAVAQDRHRWRVVVNAIMNLLVPQYAGNSLFRETVFYGVNCIDSYLDDQKRKINIPIHLHTYVRIYMHT